MNYRKRLNQIDEKLQAMPENDGTVVRINAEWSKVLNPVNGKVRYYIDHRKPFGRKYPENTYGGTRPPKMIATGATGRDGKNYLVTRFSLYRRWTGERPALSSYAYQEADPHQWNLLEFFEDFDWLRENWKDEWGPNQYEGLIQPTDEEIEAIRKKSVAEGFFMGDIAQRLSGIRGFNARTGEWDADYVPTFPKDDRESEDPVGQNENSDLENEK